MTSVENMSAVAVVPARFASVRFPGKVVATVAGKPLLLHTCARAESASLVSQTIIAADDQRILDALRPFDVTAVMTRPQHPTGSDRVAEVAATIDADIVVNVQADEVLIDPHTIDATIEALIADEETVMATACCPIGDLDDAKNPNVVKVVRNRAGRALYFSRSRIPHVRDAAGDAAPECLRRHIGIYAYRREFLLQYASLPQTPLERLEKLEQLRVLEHGYPIAVIETNHASISVDAPEDLARVRAALEASP